MRPLLVVVVIALVATACAEDADTAPAPSAAAPATSEAAASPTAVTPDGESVSLEAVLDGDSLAVTRSGARTEVRLAGINAPEMDECHGDAARDALEELVGEGPVILVPVGGEDDADQFGRLLRNVWVEGVWLNERLVAAGDALALQTGSADEDALVAAGERAWESGLGMWGPTACGEFPAGVVITDVRYDPEGRDRDNTEEEFVLIANEGDAAVDLTGWIVRDESSQHRYRFPALVLEPGDGVRLRTGCGTDSGRDHYWCAGDAVWSNGGDTVILQTATGTVVDRLSYRGDF